MPLKVNPITGKFDVVQDVNKEYGKINNRNTGFVNRTDSTLSFEDGDREFTITPAVDKFVFYSAGKKFTKTTSQTVVIDDTEGLWYIYFNKSGVLVTSQTPWSFSDGTVFTSIVYWDATNNMAIGFGDERHGLVMDWSTHQYLHETKGAVWEWGLTPSVIADGNGSLNAHAEMQSVSLGEIHDEDIEHYHPEQTSYYIWYLDGANADLRKTISLKPSLVDITTTRPNWNEFTGGVWQRTEVSNTNFVLSHLFSTNSARPETPNLIVMGQNEYTTKGAAQTGAQTEINSLVAGNAPTPEFVPVATFIIECRDSFSNSYNARVVSTEEGADFVDWRENERSGAGASVSDHGNLTGLMDDDHIQYLLADGTRVLQPTIDSVNAWQMKDSAGNVDFNYDSTNRRLTIGSATSSAKLFIDNEHATSPGLLVKNTLGATGNNIQVWDSASTKVMIVDEKGHIGVGATNPSSELHIQTQTSGRIPGMLVEGLDAYTNTRFKSYSDTSWHGNFFAFYRSRGDRTTPTTVVSGDSIFLFDNWAYDGADWDRVSQMNGAIDGTVSAGVMPSKWTWQNTNAAGDLFTSMSLRATGYLGIGKTTPTGKIHSYTTETTTIGLIIEGVASQSADLQQWKSSTGILSVVDADGKLGIGTSNPSYPLEVVDTGDVVMEARTELLNGDATLRLTNTNQSWGFKLEGEGGGNTFRIIDSTNAKEIFEFFPNSDYKMSIQTTNAFFNATLADIDTIIRGNTDANLLRVIAGTDSVAIGDYAVPNGEKFYVNGITNINDTLYSDGTGNIGIGTSTPAELLHLSKATGTATIDPNTIRIATTNAGSDWSTSVNRGNLDFYSADTSHGGAGVKARIGARAASTAGGSTDLVFESSGTTGNLDHNMVLNSLGQLRLNGDVLRFSEGRGLVYDAPTNRLGFSLDGSFNINTSVFVWDDNGKVGINDVNPSAALHVNTGGTTNIGQIIEGVASQTADLQQWKNSLGILNVVDADGNVGIGTSAPESLISIEAVGNEKAFEIRNDGELYSHMVSQGSGGTNGWGLFNGMYLGLQNTEATPYPQTRMKRTAGYGQISAQGSAVTGAVPYDLRLTADSDIQLYAESTILLWPQNNGDIILAGSGNLRPFTTEVMDIGLSTRKFKDLWMSGDALIGGNVGIGTTAPNSKLEVNGAISTSISTKTADYTLLITDSTILGNATSLAITITLPTAVGIDGRKYTIKKIDSSVNFVTIDGDNTETIDGATTFDLQSQYEVIEIQSDGANWWII